MTKRFLTSTFIVVLFFCLNAQNGSLLDQKHPFKTPDGKYYSFDIESYKWLIPITEKMYFQEQKHGILLFRKEENTFLYLNSKSVKVEFPNNISRVSILPEERFIVTVNGKMGIYQNEKYILPAEYESVTPIDYSKYGVLINYYIIKKGGKYGIFNIPKGVIVPPEYDEIQFTNPLYGQLTEILFWVKKEKLVGVINRENKECIPVVFDRVTTISPDLFLIVKNGQTSLVDAKNEIIVPYSVRLSLYAYTPGSICFIQDAGTLLYFDEKGVPSPLHYSPDSLSYSYKTKQERFVKKENDGLYALFDSTGKSITDYKFAYAKPINAKYSIVSENKDDGGHPKYGVISNNSGTYIIPNIYESRIAIVSDKPLTYFAKRDTNIVYKSYTSSCYFVSDGKETKLDDVYTTIDSAVHVGNNIYKLITKHPNGAQKEYLFDLKQKKVVIDKKYIDKIYPVGSGRYLCFGQDANMRHVFYDSTFSVIKKFNPDQMDIVFADSCIIYRKVENDLYAIADLNMKNLTTEKYDECWIESCADGYYIFMKYPGVEKYDVFSKKGVHKATTSYRFRCRVKEMLNDKFIITFNKKNEYGLYNTKYNVDEIPCELDVIQYLDKDVYYIRKGTKSGVLKIKKF